MRSTGSFRRALVVAGVITMVSFASLALALVVGLARADRLLDRVSRSQTQLALVTRLEADLNAMLLEPVRDRAAGAILISRQIAQYRRTVEQESALISAGGQVLQAVERSRAEALSTSFAALRSAPTADAVARFRALTKAIVVAERREAGESIEAMRRVRRAGTQIAIILPATFALLGTFATLAMLANLLRPIETLRRAVARLASGEAIEAITPAGFSEFDDLGLSFTGMARQIAGQRLALAHANSDLERQVAERTARLAKIDANRRLFFAQVGHELRTPITVIMGEAQVALRDDAAGPDRLRDALGHIVANGEFAHRRLEDLLKIAAAEDGRLTLRREAVDLAGILRQASARALPYARSSGIAIDMECPEEALPAMADSSWVQQALLALVDNAVKHAREGGTVDMSLEREGNVASLCVADDGPGVAASDLPRLFDTWYQAAANRRSGGSGLGLSVARWVAEAHDGSIVAENRDGGGLLVRISLPIVA